MFCKFSYFTLFQDELNHHIWVNFQSVYGIIIKISITAAVAFFTDTLTMQHTRVFKYILPSYSGKQSQGSHLAINSALVLFRWGKIDILCKISIFHAISGWTKPSYVSEFSKCLWYNYEDFHNSCRCILHWYTHNATNQGLKGYFPLFWVSIFRAHVRL